MVRIDAHLELFVGDLFDGVLRAVPLLRQLRLTFERRRRHAATKMDSQMKPRWNQRILRSAKRQISDERQHHGTIPRHTPDNSASAHRFEADSLHAHVLRGEAGQERVQRLLVELLK